MLFSDKMEAIRFRVLKLKSNLRQHFRHLHVGASDLFSVIPFPSTCTHAPRFPIVAVANGVLLRNIIVNRQLWPDP